MSVQHGEAPAKVKRSYANGFIEILFYIKKKREKHMCGTDTGCEREAKVV